MKIKQGEWYTYTNIIHEAHNDFELPNVVRVMRRRIIIIKLSEELAWLRKQDGWSYKASKHTSVQVEVKVHGMPVIATGPTLAKAIYKLRKVIQTP